MQDTGVLENRNSSYWIWSMTEWCNGHEYSDCCASAQREICPRGLGGILADVSVQVRGQVVAQLTETRDMRVGTRIAAGVTAAPWTERQHTPILPPMSMEPWTATKKALHQRGGDTSSFLGHYPTVACPEFLVGFRLGQNFSPCPRITLFSPKTFRS